MSSVADDDDLDGAPLDDLDGIPFDFNPIPIPTLPDIPPAIAPIIHAIPPNASASLAFINPHSLTAPPAVDGAPFIPSVAANKVATFDQPTKILTPFEKKRQEQEAKRLKMEQEAAQEYATFVKSFETTATNTAMSSSSNSRRPGGSTFVPKAFVSGGVIGGDPTAPKPLDPATLKASLPSTSGPTTKPLPFLPKPLPFQNVSTSPSTANASSSATTSSSHLSSTSTTPATCGPSSTVGAAFAFALPSDDAEEDEAMLASKKRKAGKPVRAIDAFLQELKQNQEEKSSSSSTSSSRHTLTSDGPRDLGDATTTNIFVGNLSPDVNEKDLVDAFAVYGDIASVKIMWPRRDEPPDASGGRISHQGFVSFMRREDAEIAIKAMHGAMLLNQSLKLNWSRSVPLPSHPIALKGSKSGGRSYAPPPIDSLSLPPGATKYDITFPTDPALKELIDLLAIYVMRYGLTFEHAMIQRAHTTSDVNLAFLTTTASLEHLYYRWRLWSLTQGDTLTHWRSRPFQMVEGGAYWVPPDPTLERREKAARRAARQIAREKKRRAEKSGHSTNHGRDDHHTSTANREKGKLSDVAQKRLMDLLRHVTMERDQIRVSHTSMTEYSSYGLCDRSWIA